MNHTGAVIVAAGQSKRMGTNKALLPVGSLSVIQHIVTTLCFIAPGKYGQMWFETYAPQRFQVIYSKIQIGRVNGLKGKVKGKRERELSSDGRFPLLDAFN